MRLSPCSNAGIRWSRSGRTVPSLYPTRRKGLPRSTSGYSSGRRQSPQTGAAQWEVRIELGTHEETVTLAERLESEGIPIVRRHTFLLAGAANEDDARALAERIRGEAPENAKVEVEPGGGMVWEVAPRNPFTFFGGLGG